MDKKQEKKIWNSQLAIENPKNDRIAVIYSVKVRSVRILETGAYTHLDVYKIQVY